MAIELLALNKDTIADATPGLAGGLLGYQTTTGGVSTLREFPSPIPVTLAYTAAVPFTGLLDMGEKTVTADITFTVNTTGSVDGAETLIDIIADGSHDVTWHATFNLLGEQTYDNTTDRLNMVQMFRRGSRYYYTVTLGPIT
jgi:hypothetical protein